MQQAQRYSVRPIWLGIIFSWVSACYRPVVHVFMAHLQLTLARGICSCSNSWLRSVLQVRFLVELFKFSLSLAWRDGRPFPVLSCLIRWQLQLPLYGHGLLEAMASQGSKRGASKIGQWVCMYVLFASKWCHNINSKHC